MRRALLLIAALFAVGAASSQTATDERRAARRAKWDRLYAIEERMRETRPQRRDAPLREENIRDEEVREIQVAARGIVPKSIVNISGVVTGCPCEEGTACSDQVWILASRPGKTLGLELSKIGNKWTIGSIQRWWLEYDALLARERTFPTYSEFREAVDAKKEEFPRCASKSEKPNE